MNGGDKSDRWRSSYRIVRKDPLRDPQATNRERLALLGVDRLSRDTRLLDVGSGDGNLSETLREQGFINIWGLEYQAELVAAQRSQRRTVIASATAIPFATGSISAAIVMDVLHHLTPDELPYCLRELRRVLEPGGLLFICEPARTRFRVVLSRLLFSPFSEACAFARNKRAMVEQERATLEPWLESEHEFPSRLGKFGFSQEFFKRCWLHHFARFRSV